MVYTVLNLIRTLLVNLIHTDVIIKRRYSLLRTIGVLLLCTLILFGSLYFLGINERTTIRSVLVGSLYIIPLYYLYKTSLKKIFIVMVYCWTYTMTLNTLAFGLVNFLEISNQLLYIFVIESTFILISVFYVFTFSKRKFTTVLEKSNNDNQNHLIVFSIAFFVTMSVIRYYIVPGDLSYVLIVLFMSVIGYMSYRLMFGIVQSNMSLDSVNIIAFKDSLTGINNRYSLFRDMNTLIRRKSPFILLFLDLDDLKNINDTYDHSFGDQYLKYFAMISKQAVLQQGEMYRFAGDEFICLITKNLDEFDLTLLETTIKQEMSRKFSYNGVSIGMSCYPKDGLDPDTLIQNADQAMYGNKRSKKIRR